MPNNVLATVGAPSPVPFAHAVERLCQLSVRKAHDPFLDIPWDAPESRIDPRDPRFQLLPNDPLGATDWYRQQTPDVRARIGLELLCQCLRFSIVLETALGRGLLAFIGRQPRDAHVTRYALHEVIEECRHSLMFQAFLDRAGCTTHGLNAFDTWNTERVVRKAPSFPELFFIFVLAGEIFIDADNRHRLAHKTALHPLIARILQIHVTEEARHIRFAERYLVEHVPTVNAPRTWWMRRLTPIILRENARTMMQPSPSLVRRFGIPRAVLREAFGPGTAHREHVREISAPVEAMLYPSAARSGLGFFRR